MTSPASDKKKRQAILAGALLVVVVGLAWWDFSGSGPTAPSPVPVRVVETSKPVRTSTAKGRASALPSSFRLRLDLLARSEGMEYGDGHDVFGGAPAPVAIETPVAPVRPAAVAPHPAAPVVSDPPVEVSYKGFAQSNSGDIDGLFTRGSDIAVARTGEIIFHRFRVDAIHDASAQITDLSSNRSHPLMAETGN